MAESFDVVVIGGGIAGASAAAELAAHRRVLLLEAEDHPGYHATGRSAATYSPAYGNAAVRALNTASGQFFFHPPAGFSESSLVHPRDLLTVAGRGQRESLAARQQETPEFVEPLSVAEACRRVPILAPDRIEGALLDRAGGDLDVDALLQGFLRLLRRRGGRTVSRARVDRLRRNGNAWRIATAAGEFESAVVINAAGAWADELARLGGLAPLGLQPLRRTAILIEMPAGLDPGAWPMVWDAAETFYFKPDAGALLVSPADETPSAPCDAAPEEIDVAVAVERFENVTTMTVRRVTHRWAGLRTFAPDRTPVIGFDPRAEGFFWLAGQGGYGVMTSPALAALACTLVCGIPPAPGFVGVLDLAAALSPQRLL
jgi:D-arginine dehydrogenase